MRNKTPNTRGSLRESIERNTQLSDKEGDIMTIAVKDVVYAVKTTSVKEAAVIMAENDFRRLPIIDPGSKKLIGFLTAMDILDFLGGGNNFKLVEEKYGDNFLAAINKPIKEIMVRDVKYVTNKDSIKTAITMMLENDVGALPILDAEGKLAGIVTERDFALLLSGTLTDELVQDFMSEKVIYTTPGTPLEAASKIMVRNKLRRIPVVGKSDSQPGSKLELEGIITATDILDFLGKNEVFSKMESNSATEILDIKISEIMKSEVVTAEPLMRLGDLCTLFEEENIGGVPVVKNNEIMGIITEKDILKAILK